MSPSLPTIYSRDVRPVRAATRLPRDISRVSSPCSAFSPQVPDGTYYEKAEFSEATLSAPAASLVVQGPDGEHTYSQGDRVFIGGRVSGGTADLTAPLVFAGFGMTDAALELDDYKGLDVRGKIAVVLWGLPHGMDSEIGAHLQSEQARVAAQHGARGIIRIALLLPVENRDAVRR